MREVTLIEMLDARERRVWEQQSLMAQYGMPIVCFTMNIPGPVKDSPLIRRSFDRGLRQLTAAIPQDKLLHLHTRREVTGCEAMLSADLEGVELKRICTRIEDATQEGRLYDMDVLLPGAGKLDRELVGGGSRDCIVCGAPGRGCASRRVHSVPELQAASAGLMRRGDWQMIGDLAVNALLDEVRTTPKPGLVDLRNTGSHRDMDVSTFEASAEALRPYFCRCAEIGWETSQLPPRETFPLLRAAGLEAEKAMLAATGGVNTHKGAIFTIGLLCGAAGRLWDGEWQESQLFAAVAQMTRDAMQADFAAMQSDTAGLRQYAASGIRGARGEAALGLPSVEKLGLPIYRNMLEVCGEQNRAGVMTLLHLIVRAEDTNLRHRGGAEKAALAAARTAELLESLPETAQIEALDDWFIRENLSPGGCADLLAAVYFVSELTERRKLD